MSAEIYSSDGATLADAVLSISMHLFDTSTTADVSVKATSDIASLIDAFKSIATIASEVASLIDLATYAVKGLRDTSFAVEQSVKVTADEAVSADVFKSISMLATDVASFLDKALYIFMRLHELASSIDKLTLRVLIEKDRAVVREYAKYMGLEGITLKQLEEYTREARAIVEQVLPEILSKLRYVKHWDVILASDFNEVLDFARNATKVVLAMVKIMLDYRMDIPEEVMKLVTEVTELLW